VQDATVFILAGGKSSRMGSDKAFLEFGGRTLLQRALQVAGAISQRVLIVGTRSKFEHLGPVVEDIYPDRGPLGGIHAALSSSATELNLVLAVDMPFLEGRFLNWLLEQARSSGALVTVPVAGGRNQPLCAVYRKAFAAIAKAALEAGRNKIDPLFAPAYTRFIDAAELAAMDIAAGMFDNVNTRDELQSAMERARHTAEHP
jgi:molybdopterin-guanine dinucleotide biosynthesis protein A